MEGGREGEREGEMEGGRGGKVVMSGGGGRRVERTHIGLQGL